MFPEAPGRPSWIDSTSSGGKNGTEQASAAKSFNNTTDSLEAQKDNIGVATDTNISTDIDNALTKWTTAMAESYAADGSAPTPEQILFQIWARIMEAAVSGTTVTLKKLDGTTTAMTATLDAASKPTSITRAT